MKVAAIVCEYNPFHNGHEYQIKMTKQKSGADFVIAIMSGQFTQRGIPAIFDKYERAKCCLLSDVDLVIELPTVFATASAEYFAKGAVKIASSLGIVNYLSFGSECSELNDLITLADFLLYETNDYKKLLKKYLELGVSFPKSRGLATKDILGQKYSDILNEPNNILAIEYIKALKEIDSKIEPLNIARYSSSHNSILMNSEICSSSAIRNNIYTNFDPDIISSVIPKASYLYTLDLLKQGIKPVFLNDFSDYLGYKLLTSSQEELLKYNDVSKELSQKILNSIDKFVDYESYINILKTKEITHSRISRALLHILLGIDSNPDTKNIYATILGFKASKSEILGEIKKKKTLPLISKNANYKQILSENKNAIKVFETDILSNNLYEAVLSKKSSKEAKSLMKKSPIIIQ